MPNGYTGKILHVDLTNGKLEIETPPEAFYRKYMGGSAMGTYYILRDMPAGADALGPDNVLTLFTGVTTEVCVQTTMREANDRGFECLLASDATESYFPEFKAATLSMIRAQGAIVGWTATVDRIAGALDV